MVFFVKGIIFLEADITSARPLISASARFSSSGKEKLAIE